MCQLSYLKQEQQRHSPNDNDDNSYDNQNKNTTLIFLLNVSHECE